MKLFVSYVSLLLFVLLNVDFISSESIYAWGDNSYGQLGLNTSSSQSTVRVPQLISTYLPLSIVSLLPSRSFHFAVTDDARVYVAGNDYYEVLALGNNAPQAVYNPVNNTKLRNFQVFPGVRHANGISDGTLYGWGDAAGNVLGTSTGYYGNPNKALSSYQFGKTNITNVIATYGATFVTLANGTTVVAGQNNSAGQLGVGDTKQHLSFTPMNFMTSFPLKIFPSHSSHMCGTLKSNLSVYCWGENSDGQLGVGDNIDRSLPTRVPYFDDNGFYIIQITYGNSHTLALSCSGRVFAWGNEEYGQLGNDEFTDNSVPTPIEITSLADKNIVEIQSGNGFNFARTSDNLWYSWGAGYGGVLGTSNDNDVWVPALASQLHTLSINHIAVSSSSQSVFGFVNKAGVSNSLTGVCPTLVNECANPSSNNCDLQHNGTCVDTDRGFYCQCEPGFTGDARINGNSCTDINECINGTHICATSATCVNTIGSYYCQCPNNTHGDGISSNLGGDGCITNVNECAASVSPCNNNTICTDTVWAYNCTCMSGYYISNTNANGVVCNDINECRSGTYPCSMNAACQNTIGSYTCKCNFGYVGDGLNCTYNGTASSTTSQSSASTTSHSTSNSTSSSSTTSQSTSNSTSNSSSPSSTTQSSTSHLSTSSSTGSSHNSSSSSSSTSGSASGGSYYTLGGVVFDSSDDTKSSNPDNSNSGDFIIGSTSSDNDDKDVHILIGVFVAVLGLIVITVIILYVVLRNREKKRQASYI